MIVDATTKSLLAFSRGMGVRENTREVRRGGKQEKSGRSRKIKGNKGRKKKQSSNYKEHVRAREAIVRISPSPHAVDPRSQTPPTCSTASRPQLRSQ